MAAKMEHCYELMVFAAKTGNFTATEVRGILTHALANSLKGRFTGSVSREAIIAVNNGFVGHTLVVEHPHRIQACLTDYFRVAMRDNLYPGFEEFEARLNQLSEVNITARIENAALSRKGSTYASVGIELINWCDINETDKVIFRKYLSGKISNLSEFK
ncbi:hypothetical protein [Serratia fonticola]|uniref:hypothetical protein n=1 Tax=Serratia fonticola TaxID=47917 RepID=UPI00217BADF7|nr:hypothetical protein [Serratia fonticola]CAI1795077.1 Uncharacterised protein [Serratia fonticola]